MPFLLNASLLSARTNWKIILCPSRCARCGRKVYSDILENTRINPKVGMFTKTFVALNKGDAGTAGGKGASLGEMTNAEIPVPPGFVVLASTFEKFLEETDLGVEIDAILHTVNHQEMHTVENASEKIQALILGAEMPKDIGEEIKKEFKKLGAKFVAVRSSATAEDSASAAWAGQLDSFLNTNEGELLKNVQKCWASLFTPRAIFYRFELQSRTSPPLRGGVPEGRWGAGLH